MKKLVCILMMAAMLAGCGQSNDDENCGSLEVECRTTECCPMGTVCCADQDILMPFCCSELSPYCCRVDGMIECSTEPCE